MEPMYYIPIFMMLLVLFLVLRDQKHVVVKKLIKKRKTGDKTQMKELAIRFVDKECIIYTFNGNQINGVIKEVNDGALLAEVGGTLEAVNLDFVMRIREYPKKKNGKKKKSYPNKHKNNGQKNGGKNNSKNNGRKKNNSKGKSSKKGGKKK